MTLAVNMLNMSSLCTLKCKTIISNVPMCCTLYVIGLKKNSLRTLLMLTNNIILATSGHDTLKPLGILFRPFVYSTHDAKYNKRCSVKCSTGGNK